MHSIGSIVSFLQSMLRRSNSGVRKNSGISAVSVLIMWFGMTSLVYSNQKRDSCVSTAPLSVMRFFKITSKAEMRSVATITRPSPTS